MSQEPQRGSVPEGGSSHSYNVPGVEAADQAQRIEDFVQEARDNAEQIQQRVSGEGGDYLQLSSDVERLEARIFLGEPDYIATTDQDDLAPLVNGNRR